MPDLTVGVEAPPIEVPDQTGVPFNWESTRGKNVIVYFYPKADTPGCTTESCEFRDAHTSFSDKDTIVLGVSPDAPKAQSKFKDKFSLPFPLLCDTDHQVAEAYGVWKEKSMYGKKYMGIERTTFLIGKDGKIAHVFEKVKPAGHADQVMETLVAL